MKIKIQDYTVNITFLSPRYSVQFYKNEQLRFGTILPKIPNDQFLIEYAKRKEFFISPPILWGHIRKNGKIKFGQFKPEWNRYSNSKIYQYYTPKGNKGTGGFTLDKAFNLYSTNKLTQNESDWINGTT